MAEEAHFEHSTLREHIVEHVFVGDALRALWRHGVYDVEVLRGEFDAHGYDLVMARGPIVRHIQFKTGKAEKPGSVSLSLRLGEKPSGCAIWIQVSEKLDMGPYFFFGGLPGQPLPLIATNRPPRRIGRNKDGDRPERVNHRTVAGSKFKSLANVDDVLAALFGPLP